MSFVVEKHYVKRFEIEAIQRNYMKYERFSRMRKDISRCGLCDHAYREEDNTNVAIVRGDSNQLICDDCAVEAIEGGAEELNC